MERLRQVVEQAESDAEASKAYVAAAERMLLEDVAANQAIGDAGADAILAAMRAAGRQGGARVLTICNTGALATAGWGTAQGVLRTLHARGKLEMAYCLETRPYNQGSRLTAWLGARKRDGGTGRSLVIGSLEVIPPSAKVRASGRWLTGHSHLRLYGWGSDAQGYRRLRGGSDQVSSKLGDARSQDTLN